MAILPARVANQNRGFALSFPLSSLVIVLQKALKIETEPDVELSPAHDELNSLSEKFDVWPRAQKVMNIQLNPLFFTVSSVVVILISYFISVAI